MRAIRSLRALLFLFPICVAATGLRADTPVDFTTEIRPLLSNKCFACHGPDEEEREGGLRLDLREGAMGETDSGAKGIVPGDVDQSALFARITTTDDAERMPPPEFGKRLTDQEVDLLRRWITQGAEYAGHWAYEPIKRPTLPLQIAESPAGLHPIDQFVRARLQLEGLQPSPAADRYTLLRRVSLDLTGLPPTPEEVDAFLNDSSGNAYEKVVDRLLNSPAYGEHWARKWLDLARYADSAGYADDPPRTIWAYRDWVIRAINSNMPFDQFTIEQLAGDLLPNPTDDQLIATAFHRNTLTNNEGGTNDEEFRNVAIVDRVNTTMAVWMGTTMNCAQCHNHKYDPISQQEFFQFFAILNNTADADRRNESPLLEIYTDQQQQQRRDWEQERTQLQQQLATLTPELTQELNHWTARFQSPPNWRPLSTAAVTSREQAPVTISEDGLISVEEAREQDVLTVPLTIDETLAAQPLTALQLQTIPDAALPAEGSGYGGGNFVITRILASLEPQGDARPRGRFIRVEMPGQKQFLSLAEVQAFSSGENVALRGQAKQISTDFGGPAELAIDGNTTGIFTDKSTTHTAQEQDPWWEVDLGEMRPIDQIVVWNRMDDGVAKRLANFQVSLLDTSRNIVWQSQVTEPPLPKQELSLSGVRSVPLKVASADYEQSGFGASNVLDTKNSENTGWAIGGAVDQPHQLTLIPTTPIDVAPGDRLILQVEQLSKHLNHTVGRLRFAATNDVNASLEASVPPAIARLARQPVAERTPDEQQQLTNHFLQHISELLQPARDRLAVVDKSLSNIKPSTTVPVLQQLPENQLRTTRIQLRGNFLNLGDEVAPGVPSRLHAMADNVVPDRLDLAHWLIDPGNPLTPRVIANRYWEAIFGRGLVLTSEEFGSQGELPTHPQLLNWLASELLALDWDTKAFVKELVMSATYRQSSAVNEAQFERDPDNSLLARGPRVRLTAEMIRDQALLVSGLLSSKLYGPPVKPMQPNLGLNA
ncbi:MAG: DUF1549 domain-containing protein, partial [Planctomycetaceae bacterium]|nr:DUF1549 domain-containing protein [Planctomycetaceae bacterium]